MLPLKLPCPARRKLNEVRVTRPIANQTRPSRFMLLNQRYILWIRRSRF
jgi:hypothetical protein